MQKDDLIEIEKICSSHNLEMSFIEMLREHDLIVITKVEETTFIPSAELGKLEKILRLHHELDINLEGIDAIQHLLDRIREMQDEIFVLKNRLYRYESRELPHFND